MNRCKYVVAIVLFASEMGCTTIPGDESEPDTDEAPWEKKPPKGDPVEPPSGGDGGGSPPPSSGSPTFVDACLLPGMTKATFNPTSTFDAHDEGVTAALSLPFTFTLYGTAHTKFWITTNGQLGFGSTPGGSAFGQVTCPLADPRFSTPIVLVYSADLIGRLESHAGVCYATTGTAPNRKLVVTWKDSFFYDAWLTSNVTFSATLNEGTNAVDVVIQQVDAPSLPDLETGFGSALGKQAGGSAQAFSCYQPNAPEGTAIRYNP